MSIIAIKLIGLPGVFVGTIISRMIVVIVRPYIVYKYVLKQSVLYYYIRLTIRTIIAFGICFVMWQIKRAILVNVTIVSFVIICFLTALIPNLLFILIFARTDAFKGIIEKIRK